MSKEVPRERTTGGSGGVRGAAEEEEASLPLVTGGWERRWAAASRRTVVRWPWPPPTSPRKPPTPSYIKASNDPQASIDQSLWLRQGRRQRVALSHSREGGKACVWWWLANAFGSFVAFPLGYRNEPIRALHGGRSCITHTQACGLLRLAWAAVADRSSIWAMELKPVLGNRSHRCKTRRLGCVVSIRFDWCTDT